MRGGAAFVLCPGRILITLGSRADHHRIDERPFAHASAIRFKIARDRLKQAAVETAGGKQAAETHEGGAFRSRLIAGKPQKRRKLARSESASESATSERSYQVASNSALNIAKGGHAFSPLGLR
jgi:hypothetical protein